MVSLSQIYEDVSGQGIRLFQYELGDLSDAAILRTAKGYGVFLDFNQYPTLREFKSALSHEVGHCATGALHAVGSPYEMIERNEYKANRWAYERYFPLSAFRQAFRAGYTEPWQLAEWFDMPQQDVEAALRYWVECRGVDLRSLKAEP